MGVQTILCGDRMKADPSSLFGSTPYDTWNEWMEPDRNFQVSLVPHSLLILSDAERVLIDPRVVTENRTQRPANTTRGILQKGILPRDISAVVLTHLDAQTIYGVTTEQPYRCAPKFPEASVFVQAASHEEAMTPNERMRQQYNSNDYNEQNRVHGFDYHGRLQTLEERFALQEGSMQLIAGIDVVVRGGHAAGFQSVHVHSGRGAIPLIFAGELIPTVFHLLNPRIISSYDRFPEESYAAKRDIIREAMQTGAAIIPAYSHVSHNGPTAQEHAFQVSGDAKLPELTPVRIA